VDYIKWKRIRMQTFIRISDFSKNIHQSLHLP